MVPDCLVFPVDFFVRVVERVGSSHLEYGHVSPKRWSSVGNVRHANAWLGNHQRVCGWWGNAFGYVWLKVNYACMSEVDVLSPPCHNGIGLNPSVSMFLKIRQESFTHLS